MSPFSTFDEYISGVISNISQTRKTCRKFTEKLGSLKFDGICRRTFDTFRRLESRIVDYDVEKARKYDEQTNETHNSEDMSDVTEPQDSSVENLPENETVAAEAAVEEEEKKTNDAAVSADKSESELKTASDESGVENATEISDLFDIRLDDIKPSGADGPTKETETLYDQYNVQMYLQKKVGSGSQNLRQFAVQYVRKCIKDFEKRFHKDEYYDELFFSLLFKTCLSKGVNETLSKRIDDDAGFESFKKFCEKSLNKLISEKFNVDDSRKRVEAQAKHAKIIDIFLNCFRKDDFLYLEQQDYSNLKRKICSSLSEGTDNLVFRFETVEYEFVDMLLVKIFFHLFSATDKFNRNYFISVYDALLELDRFKESDKVKSLGLYHVVLPGQLIKRDLLNTFSSFGTYFCIKLLCYDLDAIDGTHRNILAAYLESNAGLIREPFRTVHYDGQRDGGLQFFASQSLPDVQIRSNLRGRFENNLIRFYRYTLLKRLLTAFAEIYPDNREFLEAKTRLLTELEFKDIDGLIVFLKNDGAIVFSQALASLVEGYFDFLTSDKNRFVIYWKNKTTLIEFDQTWFRIADNLNTSYKSAYFNLRIEADGGNGKEENCSSGECYALSNYKLLNMREALGTQNSNYLFRNFNRRFNSRLLDDDVIDIVFILHPLTDFTFLPGSYYINLLFNDYNLSHFKAVTRITVRLIQVIKILLNSREESDELSDILLENVLPRLSVDFHEFFDFEIEQFAPKLQGYLTKQRYTYIAHSFSVDAVMKRITSGWNSLIMAIIKFSEEKQRIYFGSFLTYFKGVGSELKANTDSITINNYRKIFADQLDKDIKGIYRQKICEVFPDYFEQDESDILFKKPASLEKLIADYYQQAFNLTEGGFTDFLKNRIRELIRICSDLTNSVADYLYQIRSLLNDKRFNMVTERNSFVDAFVLMIARAVRDRFAQRCKTGNPSPVFFCHLANLLFYSDFSQEFVALYRFESDAQADQHYSKLIRKMQKQIFFDFRYDVQLMEADYFRKLQNLMVADSMKFDTVNADYAYDYDETSGEISFRTKTSGNYLICTAAGQNDGRTILFAKADENFIYIKKRDRSYASFLYSVTGLDSYTVIKSFARALMQS